ncbi:DUF441 domain-containing protein [Ammoniphilus sp. CFH 90114]|uniref:DUF441 domain-containing protein n=1 Tax=Ammoniphilus sp. CFH 90114 TaxID=2493665 RepID=UPI00100FE216|nr:DUF441 domain-containing protein [Ammoniphilus sp. CFH 90114]RXT04779.1 DUF441 domain-containing protein [Ammoniphilus sp. CFH 90114]
MLSVQPYLLLLVLLVIGLIGKNQSIVIASSVLIAMKLFHLDKWIFPPLQKNGINWGVTILMIAVLVPIATGAIGFQELWQSVTSPAGVIALVAGIVAAVIPIPGISLLKDNPTITTAIVAGTILSVSLFKGIPVGPLIAAGLAAFFIQGYNLFSQFFR